MVVRLRAPLSELAALGEEIMRFFRLPDPFEKRNARLIGGKPSPYKAVEARKDRPTQTMEVAFKDLPKLCNQTGYTGKSSKPFKHSTGNNEKSSIVTARLRPVESMNQSWFPNPNPEPTLDLMPLDEGLPEEFAEYLKGAIAYHRNQFPVALGRPGKSC